MITDAQLKQVMPNLPQAKRQLYLPPLNAAMTANAIDVPLRVAAFVAQLAHESGEFRWMEEIWGPTPAQQRYEPPGDLAAKLGNTQAGDGKRFKGRGPIQITGRFNYAKYGGLLGIDLAGNPDLAATPAIAFATAGLFWMSNGLNALADAQRFEAVTRRINGGVNGLADRQKYYARALQVLGEGFVADEAAPTPRGRPRSADIEPLARGSEAVFELMGEQKPPRRRAVAKKAGAGKVVAKKGAAKTVVAKKVVAKKAVAKKAVAENTVAKKAVARKRAAAKSAG